MARRIFTGVILTLALFVLARRLSMNRPREIEVEEGGLRISHVTVLEQVGPGEPSVELTVSPGTGDNPRIQFKSKYSDGIEELPMTRSGDGVWTAKLPDLGKGRRLSYAFLVTGPGGATIRLPARSGQFFLIKYKGEYSIPVVVLHVIFLFGAFFFMIQSMMGAVRILKSKEGKAPTVRMTRGVMLFTFVGGWPLGWILNYQRFGVMWEGFPFGYDITDNKTQLIFIFWMVTVLLVRGSFFGRGEEKDVAGARGFALAVLISFVVSVALYILPHSL